MSENGTLRETTKAEAQIVGHMLRSAQHVAIALDKGFSADVIEHASLRFVAEMAVQHADLYGDVLDYDTVERKLQDMEKSGRVDEKMSEGFLSAYEKVAEKAGRFNKANVRQAEFVSLLDHYLNGRRHQKLISGMADIVGGSDGDFVAVRDQVATLMGDLDNIADGRPPEGDLLGKRSIAEAIQQHKKAQEDPESAYGVMTGIEQWDSALHGFKTSEAWIVAAYTGDGKTMTCIQIAYHAAFEQGKNVVFISTEMQKDQLRDLIYARHSLAVNKEKCIINDGDLGFEAQDISLGRLDEESLELFKATMHDVDHGKRAGRYGMLYVIGTKLSDTMQSIRIKCQSLRQHFKIDLIIIDYAALIAPRTRRRSEREEISEVMRDVKQLALNFNNGEGVAIVTAHQISRHGKESAIKRGGYYTLPDLADTSGAERNMDGVLWVLRDEDNLERKTAWLGCSKNRRGVPTPRFEVRVNFAYATFHAARYSQESEDIDDDFGGEGW